MLSKKEYMREEVKDNKIKIEETKVVEKKDIKLKLEKRVSLLSHMDAIRSLTYIDKEKVLVSASEDCLVKLWNMSDILKKKCDDMEPYYTLRGHAAPIFSICQSNNSSKRSLLYTAGSEGNVRIWELPEPSKIIPYEKIDDKNYQVGFLKAHNEAIWQVIAHPSNVS